MKANLQIALLASSIFALYLANIMILANDMNTATWLILFSISVWVQQNLSKT